MIEPLELLLPLAPLLALVAPGIGTSVGLHAGGRVVTEAQIAQGNGSIIGTAAAIGNITAAFDSTTSQGASACRQNGTPYIGKTLSAAKALTRAVVHGSNDSGFSVDSNGSVTLSLYGKNGTAPANSTNGTLLGSITFTDTNNESAGREILSSDAWTKYDHVWIAGTGWSGTLSMVEIVFFENTSA